ncbi:MAG: 50S ribosomal protein L25 [Candidatus Aminicenantes bacterium]|nr:50S ribosomal protein L25 [Candidatus Aminicenantes bacterium]
MTLTINAEKREAFGKNASRRLRRQGQIPAVLYGEGTFNVPLALSKKDVIAILKSETGENTIFKVAFNSRTQDAMIKELQVDSRTDELLHVDLIKISMDKAVRVSVPILLQGDPVGVKTEGGFVDFMTREAEVECLPGDIPESVKVDISGLHLHQSLKVGDITPPPGVKIISDPQAVVVLIGVPHVEEVEAKAVEEEVIAEPAEPEVIKKERAAGEEKE